MAGAVINGKLFKIENAMITFNREELRYERTFETIIKRDQIAKRSLSGNRKKPVGMGELIYIFCMADPESPFAKLDVKDQMFKAKKFARLPEDWKPDNVVREGMDRYHELFSDIVPSYGLLNNLERGLNLTGKVISEVVDNLSKKLDLVKSTSELSPDSIMNVDALISGIGTLLKLAEQIPKSLDAIEAVRARVLVEKGEGVVKKGGYAIGNRENPEYLKERFPEAVDADNDSNPDDESDDD